VKPQILIIVLLVIAVAPSPAPALRILHEKGIEIHETIDEPLVESFVDDVMSLLPAELAQRLAAERTVLLEYATVTPRDNYWSVPAISKREFIRNHGTALVRNDDQSLARDLGRMVQDIVEVAMTPAHDDLLGEEVRANIVRCLDRGRYDTHVIRYDGFRNIGFETTVDRLYTLRGLPKKTLYPDIVAATADLWTAIWQEKGNTPLSRPKSFVRRPFVSAIPPANGTARKGRFSRLADGKKTVAARKKAQKVEREPAVWPTVNP